MSLSPGTRFGAFEVHSRLGAGGMGEVFKAHDTRLGRDVAIKVLPAGFASDRERLDRLSREARSLAALNHPGIAAIFDTVEIDGVRGLVLEFVDGETVEERLRRGAMSVPEALATARAIADALDAAHDQGLVHRDVKPANIKLTPAGDVKLLDFGIARLNRERHDPGAMTATATEQGVIVGTAAYMSPEQARGQAVDKRTDVWAFGCVLYEMLAGRAAFKGPTWSDSVAKTLSTEPDWAALPAATPSGVVRLLQRCLHKDAKHRLRGLGGIDLSLEPAAYVSTPATGRGPLLGIAAAALIAAVAGGFWIASRPATPVVDSSAMRFEIPPAIRVAEAGTFGLSPDGRRIVFIGTGADGRFRMWERSLDSLETRPINGSEGEVSGNTTLFWSPDGSSIGFYADGAVRRIAREGGTATVVCRVRGIAVGGTWNAAGDIVVGNTAGGLMRCPASGGEAVPLTAGGSDTAGAAPSIHLFPVFLRDGQRLLYLRVSRADPSLNGLFIADLQLSPEQQSQTRVLETGFGARYSVDESGERIIFVRNRDLWAVPFSSDRGVTEGEPVQIATSVYTFRDGASFDVQRNMLVFRGGAGGYQLMLRNRSGEELSQIGEPGSYAGVALSPDGTRVAVTRENQLNRSDQDIWFIDVARGTTSRFTADPLPESAPAWSADGRSVVFASGHDDATIRARRLDGEEQILLDHKALDQMTVNPLLATFSASRDGRWLVFNMDTRGQRRSDIWILPLQEPRQPKPLIEGQFDQRQPRISPDQRWLAYVSNESGADEVYVRPLTWGDAPATGAAVVVSRRGGRSPRWSGDSQELLFQSLNGEMMSALVNGTSFAEATPLFAAPGALAEWDVTADGQRLLLAHPTDSRELPFTVVVNWRQTRD